MDTIDVLFEQLDDNDMLKFVDAHWKRIFNVIWHDDYDGCYWIVRLKKEKEK